MSRVPNKPGSRWSLVKVEPPRSRKFLDSAKYRACDVLGCKHDPDTVVGCHVRYDGSGGMGVKPSDKMVLFLCHEHHAQMDGRNRSGDGLGLLHWLWKNILLPRMEERFDEFDRGEPPFFKGLF